MGLIDEIKNLEVTIKIPEINTTLKELGYDNEYIQTWFIYDGDGDFNENDVKEAIKEDINDYLCEFIKPEIIINGHISI